MTTEQGLICKSCGETFDAVLGHNCRGLQPRTSNPRALLRELLDHAVSVQCDGWSYLDWRARALTALSATGPVQTEACPVCRTVHDKPLCAVHMGRDGETPHQGLRNDCGMCAPETGAALTFDTTFQRMRESLRKLIEATERFDNPGDYGVSSCAPVMNEARAALREANEIEKAALHDLLARTAEELLNCDASGRPTGSCGDLGMEIKRRLGEKTSGELPESLRDPLKVLERGRAIDKVGLNSWRDMDPYERAVRIAEEWHKPEETRKFLVEIIKLAERLGGFDHDTKWRPSDVKAPHE